MFDFWRMQLLLGSTVFAYCWSISGLLKLAIRGFSILYISWSLQSFKHKSFFILFKVNVHRHCKWEESFNILRWTKTPFLYFSFMLGAWLQNLGNWQLKIKPSQFSIAKTHLLILQIPYRGEHSIYLLLGVWWQPLLQRCTYWYKIFLAIFMLVGFYSFNESKLIEFIT